MSRVAGIFICRCANMIPYHKSFTNGLLGHLWVAHAHRINVWLSSHIFLLILWQPVKEIWPQSYPRGARRSKFRNFYLHMVIYTGMCALTRRFQWYTPCVARMRVDREMMWNKIGLRTKIVTHMKHPQGILQTTIMWYLSSICDRIWGLSFLRCLLTWYFCLCSSHPTAC